MRQIHTYVLHTIIWKKKYLNWSSWRILFSSCRLLIPLEKLKIRGFIYQYCWCLSIKFNHKSCLFLPYHFRSFSLSLSTVWSLNTAPGLFSHMEKTVPAYCIAFSIWFVHHTYTNTILLGEKNQYQFKGEALQKNCTQ